jgi:hypothetical protein
MHFGISQIRLSEEISKEEIGRYCFQYSAHLGTHPNNLLVNLMEQPDTNKRLLKKPAK